MAERQKILIDDSKTASEAISEYTGVTITGGEVATAAEDTAVDGIALNSADEGQQVRIALVGLTTLRVGTASGISDGDIITVDANGEGAALAGSGNFGNIRANEDAGADGDFIRVYVDVFNNSNVTEGE